MKKCRCKKCDTPLSIYNPGDHCFAHTPGVPVREKSPVTLITSYDCREISANHMIHRPGMPGYNEVAFKEVEVGFINEEREVEEWKEK